MLGLYNLEFFNKKGFNHNFRENYDFYYEGQILFDKISIELFDNENIFLLEPYLLSGEKKYSYITPFYFNDNINPVVKWDYYLDFKWVEKEEDEPGIFFYDYDLNSENILEIKKYSKEYSFYVPKELQYGWDSIIEDNGFSYKEWNQDFEENITKINVALSDIYERNIERNFIGSIRLLVPDNFTINALPFMFYYEVKKDNCNFYKVSANIFTEDKSLNLIKDLHFNIEQTDVKIIIKSLDLTSIINSSHLNKNLKIEIVIDFLNIKCYGETVEEDTRLAVLTNNLGVSVSPQDYYIFYQSDIKDEKLDWKLINSKRKELLI